MYSRQDILTRLRAGAIHLGISALIALLLIVVVFKVWYPAPLDEAAGVRHIYLLILGIDVTIGPCLTCLVFDTRKRSLRFDLSVIALLQLGALGYGMATVFVARPAYVVFNVDRFDLVLAKDIDPKSEARSKTSQYRRAPVTGPRWLSAVMPTDTEERNKILFQAVGGGYDLPQLPEYYAPLSAQSEVLKKRVQPLETLRSDNLKRASAEQVDRLLAPYLKEPQRYGFLPLRAPVQDMAVIVQRDTGAVVKILPLYPWSD